MHLLFGNSEEVTSLIDKDNSDFIIDDTDNLRRSELVHLYSLSESKNIHVLFGAWKSPAHEDAAPPLTVSPGCPALLGHLFSFLK